MNCLTHWGRVTHICVNKLWTIGSDNDLSPGRRQAIIWNNVGILFTGHLGTNFSENQIEISTFSFKKMRLKMSSGKWRPFCLSLSLIAFNQALTTVSMSLMYLLWIEHVILSRLFRIRVQLSHWGQDKWTPFRRRHFQMHFLQWKCYNYD